MKFCNKGDKTLTIHSSAKAEERDYKAYDRTLYAAKTVSIAPGKTAYINFFVKGGVTWYDEDDFNICYKFTYDGVTHEAIARTSYYVNPSLYKKSGKWYTTFWASYAKWYDNWYYK